MEEVLELTALFVFLGTVRILIGATPMVVPGLGLELFGFPEEHDNPSARLMGRLFGVRDIGLGVMVFLALDYPEWLGFVCLFNAIHDLGDVVSFGIPLVRRDGIDRAALSGAAVASSAVVIWLVAWWLV